MAIQEAFKERIYKRFFFFFLELFLLRVSPLQQDVVNFLSQNETWAGS